MLVVSSCALVPTVSCCSAVEVVIGSTADCCSVIDAVVSSLTATKAAYEV